MKSLLIEIRNPRGQLDRRETFLPRFFSPTLIICLGSTSYRLDIYILYRIYIYIEPRDGKQHEFNCRPESDPSTISKNLIKRNSIKNKMF